MKRLKIICILFLTSYFTIADDIEIPLENGWQFRQAKEVAWLPATVPGTVHTDLLNNKIIDDPYFGQNKDAQGWIKESDWEYKTVFNVSSEIITKDKILLDFQGLDTYADIYLNDSLILIADNMFRSWQVDVEGVIKSGNNELRILFHSPTKRGRQFIDELKSNGLSGPPNYSENALSFFSRKPAYHYGLAGNHGILTSGIWRPIVLKAWDIASIEEFTVHQKLVEKNTAQLILKFKYLVTQPMVTDLEVLVDGRSNKKIQVELDHGQHEDNLTIAISNPKLWWPNGLGEQKLYEIELVLSKEGKVIDSEKTKIGLRTIELIQEKDKDDKSFVVNGTKLFIKGASYVPQDYFVPSISMNKYNQLLQLAADANINMLRVWGGGIYENDIFYDLCDEKGILVWQDFMISRETYLIDDDFVENIRLEATENVKRLSQHPSLALWSVNNKINDFTKNNAKSGSNLTYPINDEDASSSLLESRNRIFQKTLPEIVKDFGLGVPFWTSAPADEMKGEDDQAGDNQESETTLELKSEKIGGVAAEFGFQSFPSLSTIKTYTNEEDLNPSSEIIKMHQQSGKNDNLIANKISKHFNDPKDFGSYIYVSQMLQAEAIKATVEAHRMRGLNSTGLILHQLNDSWPATSYSIVDYYGEAKAAKYYLARTFQQSIAMFEINDEEIKIHAVSDLKDELKGSLVVELSTFNGKIIYSEEKKIRVKPNSSQMVWKGLLKDLLKKQKKEEVYIKALIKNGENLIAENYFLFVPFKELNLDKPNIKYEFIDRNDQFFVKLTSDKTAFGVCFDAAELNLQYSDNYFVLHSKETKLVEIKGRHEFFEIKNKLSVKSLIDSYEP